jgi:hypothetical protein
MPVFTVLTLTFSGIAYKEAQHLSKRGKKEEEGRKQRK